LRLAFRDVEFQGVALEEMVDFIDLLAELKLIHGFIRREGIDGCRLLHVC